MECDDKWLLRELQDVKHIFGDKWTIPVMVALADGPLRRSEILATVSSYSIDEHWPGGATVLHDSILTRALRRMVAEGLVVRHELRDSFPRHVRYELRPEAEDFLTRVRHVVGWSKGNEHVVARAQAIHRVHNGENADCDDEGCNLPASG